MIKRGSILLLLCLIMNCSEDKPTGPSRDDFRYPLRIGNEWHYKRQVTLTFDVKSGVRAPEVTASSVRVHVAAEQILHDSLTTLQVEENGSSARESWTSASFYQNRVDGLYLLSGVIEPIALPKGAGENEAYNRILTPGDYPAIAATSFLYDENSMHRVLEYPMQVGTEWSYAEQNRPRRIHKKVIGKTDVTTDAGTFKAVIVQWFVDFDADGEFDSNLEYFDYIANEGLVKRSFLIRNLPVVDDDGGNIGSYDYRDESLLSSFIVK